MSDDDSNPSRCSKFTAERSPIGYEKTNENNTESQDLEDVFGPALPPHLIAKNILKPPDESAEDCGSAYGPQLPQRLLQDKETTEIYGPKIPEMLERKNMIGPQVPDHLLPTKFDEDHDDETEDVEDVAYGPSLSLMTQGNTPLPVNFRHSKPKESSETNTKRESWMTELPPERAANFGLGPRHFRTKIPTEKECDRRGWTETPSDKEKSRASKDDAKIIKQKQIDEKNKEMESLISKLLKKKKKKEKESLVEIHKKKAMKKAKKESKKQEKEPKPVERRPFDRNIDLQVHRFDESQKRAILRKAALLHNRFESGESKFL